MVIPNDKAKKIINSLKYLTIATVDEANQPWSTPVAFFHFDDNYIFYWASYKENQHSTNIKDNPKVFISIFDSTPTNDQPALGVYVLAEAFEISNTEEASVAAQVFKDDPYNPPDGNKYLGSYPRRIYKAVPYKIWLNSDDQIDSNFVDLRIEAEG